MCRPAGRATQGRPSVCRTGRGLRPLPLSTPEWYHTALLRFSTLHPEKRVRHYLVFREYLRGAALVWWLSINIHSVWAQDWPQFRGPTGQGLSEAVDLPLTWSETENVAWKIQIPGRGWSSPVVLENKIWLTTGVAGGRSLQGGHSLRAVGIDLDSGRFLHDVEVFRLEGAPSLHEKNTSASPTPILEEGRVYVHFGTFGTAALDSHGKTLWKSRRFRYTEQYGPGGTPALGEDLLVVSCDGTDKQFVAALDKNNGKVRWKTCREDGDMAYSTPLVIRSEGLQQVVSTGGNQAVSYELSSGKKLWWIRYRGFSQVPRPLFAHGLVYLVNPAGEGPPILYAVCPQGRGNVSDSHVVWTWQRGVPVTPSPLIVGDEIYFVSDNGILTCLDARDGRQYWRERLGGNFSASPAYADGKIFFLSEEGKTTVIKPGSHFEKLAENQLDGRTLASIAIVDRSILIRSDTHLYRIEKITAP